MPVLPGFVDGLLAGATTQNCALIAEHAQKVMDGQFSALGQAWPTFSFAPGATPIWHLDPVTGAFWPNEPYCFEVSYRSVSGIGDVKYVWEFGRLQFLQPVAAHAYLSNDTAAITFIERAIESWYEANPPFRGVSWSSGIELALRAISLLVVTSLVGAQLSPYTQKRICTILHAHAFWLDRYPSRFSSANNHLVSEEAALYLIGLSCDFLPDSWLGQRVESIGKALAREAALQILPDGVPAEQSPTYGALTAELLLFCAFGARAAGQPLAPVLSERLADYAEHVHWLADGDGFVPAIGDDDEGRVITLARHEARYPASVAAAITSFLGRPDIAVPFDGDLRNVLLPPVCVAARPAGTRSFKTGGYTVHRQKIAGRQTALVVDHAPLGYLSIAAHGHADALAFTLSVDDQPILVDPGTYLYHSGKEWRDWFRGTRAHNTVTVGGADQSTIAGAFNWSHKAHATLESLSAEPFHLTASHDGYADRFGCLHRREMVWEDGTLRVTDALVPAKSGTASQDAEVVFQLALGCTTQVSEAAVTVFYDNLPVLCLHLPNANLIVSQGGEMDGGWVSPSFGVKQPAPRISWRGRIGPEGVTTRITVISAAG